MLTILLLTQPLYSFGQALKVATIWHNQAGDFKQDSLKKIQQGSPISLHFKELISILFTTETESKASYKYRIVGDESYEQWTSLGHSLLLELPKLDGGTYTLELANEHNTLVYRSKIIVEQPFWQTKWFVALIILYVLVLIGVGIYLFFLYDFRQKLKMQAVRNRIAADLHDEVGSNLSSIAIYTELLRKKASEESLPLLQKIIDNSKESVSLMQDTVWAINPKNDSNEKLFERMKAFGSEVLTAKDIALDFNNNLAEKDFAFSMEQRKNIYLVYKEAINNIAKHSKATKVEVKIFEQNNQIEILIIDNGQGFDTNTNFEGNGLKNYRSRAEEAEIEVAFQSEIDKGTEVKIVMNK